MLKLRLIGLLALVLCSSLWLTARADDKPAKKTADIVITCDNEYILYVNGAKVGEGTDWNTAQALKAVELKPGNNIIAVQAKNTGGPAGLIALIKVGDKTYTTNADWKVSGAEAKNWNAADFDDKDWKPASSQGKWGADPWGKNVAEMPDEGNTADWIWSADVLDGEQTVYFRYTLKVE